MVVYGLHPPVRTLAPAVSLSTRAEAGATTATRSPTSSRMALVQPVLMVGGVRACGGRRHWGAAFGAVDGLGPDRGRAPRKTRGLLLLVCNDHWTAAAWNPGSPQAAVRWGLKQGSNNPVQPETCLHTRTCKQVVSPRALGARLWSAARLSGPLGLSPGSAELAESGRGNTRQING